MDISKLNDCIFKTTVEKNVVKVTDSLTAKKEAQAKKVADSRKKLKDAFEATESTDDAIQVAQEALAELDPKDVIEVIVSSCADVIDQLSANDEPAAEEGVEEGAEESGESAFDGEAETEETIDTTGTEGSEDEDDDKVEDSIKEKREKFRQKKASK